MALVTLAQAHRHLREQFTLGLSPPSNDELDLELKLAQAEAIVLNYVTVPSPPEWTDDTDVPPAIAAAILLQLGELWRFRGDDEKGAEQTDGHLSPSVTNLLRRYRDPALA